MKLIIVTRLFSSVENFVTGKSTDVNGMPTIMEFLRYSSKRFLSVEWIIILYNPDIVIKEEKLNQLKEIYSITSIKIYPIKNFISKIKLCIFLVQINNKTILYLHNSAYWIACIKWFNPKLKVNLRITGMPYGIYSLFQNNNGYSIIKKILYKTNFNNVIFTEDGGSHCEFYKEVGGEKTKRHILLNGCDFKNVSLKQKKSAFTYIAFIGRFHWSKGLEDFIEVVKLFKKDRKFKFILMGYGEEREKIKLLTGIKYLKIIENPSHSQVEKSLRGIDYVISPNRWGFLSNVVLESVKSGSKVFAYDGKYASGQKFSNYANKLASTKYKFINENITFYTNVRELVNLIKNIKLRTKSFSNKKQVVDIVDWKIRIYKELKILRYY